MLQTQEQLPLRSPDIESKQSSFKIKRENGTKIHIYSYYVSEQLHT